MKKIDKMKRAMQSLMHSIDDKNDIIHNLKAERALLSQQHATDAQELERKDDVINGINMVLNGKDDTIHNLRRALHKRDMSVDNLREQVSNLQEKVHNLNESITQLQDAHALSPMLDTSTMIVGSIESVPSYEQAVGRTIRSKAARAEQRNSLIDFIMRDTALMMREGYCEHIGLAELEEELRTMTMEELNTQLKASIISAGCR